MSSELPRLYVYMVYVLVHTLPYIKFYQLSYFRFHHSKNHKLIYYNQGNQNKQQPPIIRITTYIHTLEGHIGRPHWKATLEGQTAYPYLLLTTLTC